MIIQMFVKLFQINSPKGIVYMYNILNKFGQNAAWVNLRRLIFVMEDRSYNQKYFQSR